MNRITKLIGAILIGAASVGLAGCATGLPAKVTRYSQLPAPAGQTFYVVPADGNMGGLEFGRYAGLVSQALQARGYTHAGAPQLATMIVRVGYGVDEGRREYTSDPFARSRYASPFYRGGYDPFYRGYFGRPYWSRYGYGGGRRSPFYYGWEDPFWYNSPYAGYGGGFGGYGGYGGYGSAIRSYTVYKSFLDLDIVRRVDNLPLFEGRAQARSQTDELGVLVPNLVEAMFTGFPGRNGETVRITVPGRRS